MAKKSMQIKYKTQKRERNKKNVEVTPKESATSFIKTLCGVLIFIGIMYLMMVGMKALGLFEAGYTKPSKEAVTISYEFIPASTVFNRSDSEYYVLFDNYKSNYTSNNYINSLLLNDKSKVVYKVDMSLKENEFVKGEKENTKARNVNELSINGVTLIKIKNGVISEYISGSDKIEEYLK